MLACIVSPRPGENVQAPPDVEGTAIEDTDVLDEGIEIVELG
jgi:hypothetical protein